jgi:formylglycine-generating enzyme required for sulfatase activity
MGGSNTRALNTYNRYVEVTESLNVFRMFRLRVPRILPLVCLAVVFAASADGMPAPGTEFQDCMACPVMKVVPGGEFVQGSPPSSAGHFHSEGVIRTVTITRPFAAGKYEVSFDQWDACIAAGRCDTVDDGDWGRGRYPVINVSWEQAVVYTDWLSEVTGKQYRLLSESEWEYAARAGLPRFRFFGLTPEQLCRVANVYDLRSEAEYAFDWEHVPCDDGFAGLAPVGSLTPNAFGLYDMQGNVAEWTQDCRNRSWRFANLDGSPWLNGDCMQRAYRGGSWLANGPRYLRTPDRYRYLRARSEDLGFRVGLSLP